jgi:hypothetical protein
MFMEETMKIQQRSSVSNYSIPENSTQEVTNMQASESNPVSLTETQRNQRLGEFKMQEQMLRSNFQQQLPCRINSQEIPEELKLDQQLDGPSEADQIARQLGRIQERMNYFEGRGLSSLSENERRSYETLRLYREYYRQRLGELNDERRVVAENEGGPPSMGARPSRRQMEIMTPDKNLNPIGTGHHYLTLVGVPGRGRWRSPAQNPIPAPLPQNQKSDRSPPNINYSNGTNSSNESHASGTDNRDYTPDQPATPEPQSSPGDIKKPPIKDKELAQDPSTGNPNDVGVRGRIPKGSPDDRSGIQQMTQPAINLFSKETGADDKERPDTGNTSGSIWNPSEGNDLGDDLPYDLSGNGASVDIEVGKALLEQIRPLNPGGPDPTKR